MTDSVIAEIISNCNDESLWIPDPFDDTQEINLVAGQVRSLINKKKLLSGVRISGYVEVHNNRKRANVILSAAQFLFHGKSQDDNDTADHILSEFKNDDRISNLRWNDKKGQRQNQKRPSVYKVDKILEISQDGFATSERLTQSEAMLRFSMSRDQLSAAIGAWKNRKHTVKAFQWRYFIPDDEEWKLLKTFRGEPIVDGYQVSSYGRLLSPFNGGPTIGSPGNTGYLQCSVQMCSGLTLCINLHVLVCIGFHGDNMDIETMEVDHIDRNKHNNTPTNLRWASRAQQCQNRVVKPRKY